MNLQKKLQNLGIEQIEKLSNEYVRAIAFNEQVVRTRLCYLRLI